MGITVISMIARLKTTERFMKTYQCGGRSRKIRSSSPARRASGCSSRPNWLDPSAPAAVVSDALRPPEGFTMRCRGRAADESTSGESPSGEPSSGTTESVLPRRRETRARRKSSRRGRIHDRRSTHSSEKIAVRGAIQGCQGGRGHEGLISRGILGQRLVVTEGRDGWRCDTERGSQHCCHPRNHTRRVTEKLKRMNTQVVPSKSPQQIGPQPKRFPEAELGENLVGLYNHRFAVVAGREREPTVIPQAHVDPDLEQPRRKVTDHHTRHWRWHLWPTTRHQFLSFSQHSRKR